MKKKKVYTRKIPIKFESKKEMIKEIQRILLHNDYNVSSVFDTTQYMLNNLISNVDYYKKHPIRLTKKEKEYIKSLSTLPKAKRHNSSFIQDCYKSPTKKMLQEIKEDKSNGSEWWKEKRSPK